MLETTKDYLSKADWRVKENSTIDYGIGGLILNQSERATAEYWRKEIYDPDITKAHDDTYIHIHDLGFLGAYCAGWSIKDLLLKGLSGVEGKTSSAPAKHLMPLINQMVNFIGIGAQEWAGAQAYSSVDTYLAPFIREDNMTYEEVKQCMQSFIFGLNFPNRWGSQSPFSNITLDWTIPNDLKEENCIVGGELLDYTYGELQDEVDMINKAFLEVMIGGDANGRGFQYPIPTYSITKDFDFNSENAKLLFEMTSKYGTPYFSNYINSDMNPSDIRSMCCRLRLSLHELSKKNGGYFGSGENTGSIGVVTINLPKLAYESSSEDEFYKKLIKYLNISKRSLELKRETISEFMKRGLYKYSKEYLGDYSNHFSTIGIIGGAEAIRNASWLDTNTLDNEGKDFLLNIMTNIKERLKDYQEETGHLYNLEATPAESTTYRFASHDKEQYPDIKTAGEDGETPYYTNSTHLPVDSTRDIFDALDIQDGLQVEYTSGTVFHAFLGQKLNDWETTANLVSKIANNYKLPYFTISPTYSICTTHGYITGEHYKCPECGNETEVYSRITGYYRPIQNWNDGKLQEFEDRTEYNS